MEVMAVVYLYPGVETLDKAVAILSEHPIPDLFKATVDYRQQFDPRYGPQDLLADLELRGAKKGSLEVLSLDVDRGLEFDAVQGF